MSEHDDPKEAQNSWDYEMPDSAMVRGDRATDPGADRSTAAPTVVPDGDEPAPTQTRQVSKRNAMMLWLALAVVGLAVVGFIVALSSDDSPEDNVATGPVPNLVGLDEAGAVEALESGGYVLGSVDRRPDDATQPGTVLGQEPDPGADLAEGATIDLVIAAPGVAAEDDVDDVQATDTIVVPLVIGLTEDEARQALADAGLSVSAVSTRVGDAADEGAVVDQVPAAGTELTAEDGVELVVSSGLPSELVPEMAGVDAEDAEDRLTAIGWEVDVREEPHATVAAGVVTASDPIARTRLTLGETVTLIVSSGPATVSVPNLLGQPALAAAGQLVDLGLLVDSTDCETQPADVSPGEVGEQSPAAGTQVEAGSTVAICTVVEVPPTPTPSPRQGGGGGGGDGGGDGTPDPGGDDCLPDDPKCR